jgi:hypothetical protein
VGGAIGVVSASNWSHATNEPSSRSGCSAPEAHGPAGSAQTAPLSISSLPRPPLRARQRSEDRSAIGQRWGQIKRPKWGQIRRPKRLRQLRTSDLPFEYLKLVPQKQYLNLLLPLRAEPEHHQLKQPPQRPVDKQHSHAPRTTRHQAPTLPTQPRRRPRIVETGLSGTHAPIAGCEGCQNSCRGPKGWLAGLRLASLGRGVHKHDLPAIRRIEAHDRVCTPHGSPHLCAEPFCSTILDAPGRCPDQRLNKLGPLWQTDEGRAKSRGYGAAWRRVRRLLPLSR